ncbi:MAG: T9SS type A sorting domain-containing protein [Bacteroidetes bacterium]|nr:T9SS type A sorting domain-containing protein [Bacteroidota bacterium]
MKWIKCFVLCIVAIHNSFGQNELSQISKEQIKSATINTSHLEFEPLAIVTNYITDFEKNLIDFSTKYFEVSNLPGIYDQVLHTPHPYPTSLQTDSLYNLTADFMHPIVLKPQGYLKFDEIVLVEPGISTDKSDGTGDYVLIEASKNAGATWHALTEEYNSEIDVVWKHLFSNSMVNGQSHATGTQSIFKQRSVNLIDDVNFFEGDTIYVRFRLSSNHTINGWGWAIDNMEIKQEVIAERSIISENFNIYPNPCQNQLTVNCSDISVPDKVDLILTNQLGTTVYRENQIPATSLRNKVIEMSDLSPGIYILIITDQAYYRNTKKIIKK